MGDGVFIEEQRKFVVRQIKTLISAKAIGEKNQEEIMQVIEYLRKDSVGGAVPIEIKHRFNIPTVNAFWSL